MQIGTRGPIVSLKWNDESAKKAWHVKFCSSSLSQGEIEAQWAIGRGNRRDADSRAADYRYGKEKKVTREEGRGEEKEERSVHTQSNSRIWFCYSVNYTPWTWASLQSTRVMRIIALRFLARRHFREGGERGGPRLIFTLPYELARFSTRFVGLIRAALLFALSPRQIFVEKFRATIKTIVQVCVCVCVCMNAWRMKFDEESS